MRYTDPVLTVDNLEKRYKQHRALAGISFAVSRGQVVGLLGPNGAGKTTTIQILLGLTLPDAGQVRYFGMDFAKHRGECLTRINTTSAHGMLQGHITPLENLRVYARLYGVPKAEHKIKQLVADFGMEEFHDQRVWYLSSGQKTRLNLAKAMLNDPELLLLDEPTASLDPDMADKTLTMIEDMRAKRQVSILYTSHNMDEVTRLCDDVVFLDKGSVVAKDTPMALARRIGETEVVLSFSASKEAVERVLDSERIVARFDGDQRVAIATPEEKIAEVIAALARADVGITGLEVRKPELEDFFIHMARGDGGR